MVEGCGPTDVALRQVVGELALRGERTSQDEPQLHCRRMLLGDSAGNRGRDRLTRDVEEWLQQGDQQKGAIRHM